MNQNELFSVQRVFKDEDTFYHYCYRESLEQAKYVAETETKSLGDTLRALRIVHQKKVVWFAGEEELR
jgi:hypothetical protein